MSEWEEVKLSEVTSYIKRGIAPKYVEDDGYPIINQKCIRDNKVVYEHSKLITKSQNVNKDKYLQDGDVYLTDDVNYIHFKFKDGIIEIQGDTIFNDNVTIKKDLTVNGKIVCDTSIEAGTTIDAGTAITAGASVTAPQVTGSSGVSSGGIEFNAHIHPQGADAGGDAQQNTGTPQ